MNDFEDHTKRRISQKDQKKMEAEIEDYKKKIADNEKAIEQSKKDQEKTKEEIKVQEGVALTVPDTITATKTLSRVLRKRSLCFGHLLSFGSNKLSQGET